MMLALAILIAAMLAILVHELGHLVAARSVGLSVVGLTIGSGSELFGGTDRFGTRWKLGMIPFGGSCIVLDRASKQENSQGLYDLPPSRRAIIYVAGPLANLSFGAALLLLSFSEGTMSLPITASEEFMIAIGGLSLLLGLFSLLPLPPLDGGRLVMIAIESISRSPFSRESECSIFKVGTAALTLTSITFCTILFINLCIQAPALK